MWGRQCVPHATRLRFVPVSCFLFPDFSQCVLTRRPDVRSPASNPVVGSMGSVVPRRPDVRSRFGRAG